MNQYLKTVVTAVFAVGTLSVLFPGDNFGKYSKILSGIIVMSVLFTPLFGGVKGEFSGIFPRTDELEISAPEYLMDEFEKEVSYRIKDKMKSETGIDFLVTVYSDMSDEAVELKEISIVPFDVEYAKTVSEYLGIEEEKITEG